MKNKNVWPLLSAIAGVFLIAMAIYGSKGSFFGSEKSQLIALVQEMIGEAILTTEDFKSEPLKEKNEITAKDSIAVAEDSEVIIKISPEDEIRLLANSETSFDKSLSRISIILKKGEIQVLKTSEKSLVDVSRDGQLIPLSSYESWVASQSIKRNIKKNSNWDAAGENDLSQEDIQKTLEKHRSKFIKCYTQLLQKKPLLKGSVNLSFRIERSGHVTQAQVSSAQLTEANFKSCLIEALGRIEFKSFTGEPISTVFPLQFE